MKVNCAANPEGWRQEEAARRLLCLSKRVAASAVLGCFFLASDALAVGKERTISVAYEFARPQMELAHERWRVTILGCETQNKIGEPRLPFRTARILLPPGATVAKTSARMLAQPVQIEMPGLIEHGSVPQPSQGQQRAEPITTPDLPVAFYPAERVQLVSVQRLEGHAIAIVRLFPMQFLPAQGRLEFCPRLEIELTLAEGRDGTELAGISTRSTSFARVTAMVDNPEALVARVPAAGASFQPASGSNGPPQFNYLLVTKAFLLPSFQPLVDWKVAEGLAVKTETMENILASQPGRDSPEKLRNYIRFAFTNWGICYVLLGGDIDTVPCRYAYVSANQPEFDSYIPCDLYYSCLDGSWNSDGDNRWGEPTDGEDFGDVDLLGEVFVGRAPVDTPQEATTWVGKTIRYEIDGTPNAGNAQFLAAYLGFYAPGVHAQGGDMLDPLTGYFSQFTVDWLDDRPFTSPQWDGTEAIAALNRPPHVAIYNGHGDVDSFMQLAPEDIDALTNQHSFLAYSVGCNAGEFDNDPFSPDCIGEQFLTRNSRGAFAAILNSRLGWFNPQNEEEFSGEFQTRFFERLLTLGQTNLGVAHQLSKHDMIGLVETSGLMTYRWCYYEINLLGDPHVALKPPFSGVTPQGTPHWWLASHGWTSNFETAALADADGDGARAWQEFVAGTSPVDAPSVLKLSLAKPSGSGAILRWPSTATRIYSVYRSTNLAPGSFARLTTGLPATPPTNSFIDTEAGNGTYFYRLQVCPASGSCVSD